MKNNDKITDNNDVIELNKDGTVKTNVKKEENNFRKALKEKQEAIERESYLYGYRSIKDSNMLSQL